MSAAPAELDPLLEAFAAETERASAALAAQDVDGVLAAIERREELLPRLTSALERIPPGATRLATATLERLASLRTRQEPLEFALLAGRDDLLQKIERLDRESARSSRYRAGDRPLGYRLDRTS